MMTEDNAMTLLKIENSCGYFLDSTGKFSPLDKATKDDLLRLVGLTLSDEVKFDKFDEQAIKHQAHQIIYKSLYEKLTDLQLKRDEFKDESERLYLKEYETYKKDIEESEKDGTQPFDDVYDSPLKHVD